MLLTPPFDKTPLDPGYIKGYPPGVRENGGQYTHAAVWYAIARAMQGEGDSAGEALLRMLNPEPDIHSRWCPRVQSRTLCAGRRHLFGATARQARGVEAGIRVLRAGCTRAGMEWMLGVRKLGNALSIDPCIPREWPGFRMDFRHGATIYRIEVSNPRNVMRGVVQIDVDGKRLESARNTVLLLDDGVEHQVQVVLG